jgi:hypothetical protein
MEIQIKNNENEKDNPKTVYVKDIMKIIENSFDAYISVEGWIDEKDDFVCFIDGYNLFLLKVKEELEKLCDNHKI